MAESNERNDISSGSAEAAPTTEQLQRLEARLARLEKYLGLAPLSETGSAPAPAVTAEKREAALEMQIGEFWLARVGIVALLIGLAFLITYPFATLPALVPCLFGYAAVAGLFALHRYWEKSYPNFARIVFTGGLFLLYFATLRLHFFSSHPAITNEALALALLVVVLAGQFMLAARQRSQFATGIVMVLCISTSLIGDARHFGLTLTTLAAATMLYLHKRHNWQALLNVTVVLVYGAHLSWLLGNPVMGRAPAAIADPGSNLVYLFICAGLFAAGNCFHYESQSTVAARITRTILNGGGFFLLANLAGLSFSRERLALLDLLIHVFFMSAATLYWLHRRSRYSTSIYSCFGYLALSAAIFAHFPAPDYFLWLGWQSLLVAVTAIWFRSKIITVTNVFIYLGLYTTYLATAPANGWVTLNFAFIALISARLLNWQQHRLELRSELLRNIYLGAACIIVPYGLYHAVPRAWVSVSWIGAAVVYFLMSRFLNNKKYRWMAIVTLLAAVAYAFLVDLARLEPVYRIISFIALGIALLVVSLFYARYRRKSRSDSI